MEIIYGRENLEEVLKVVNSAFCAVREDGFDFRYIMPKAYGKDCNLLQYHYVIKDNGKNVAAAGNIPNVIKTSAGEYKFSFLGSVATLPDCQGKGYMRTLMNRVERDDLNNGVVFSLLTGARGRYCRYGYTKCFSSVVYTFDEYFLSHTESDSDISVSPLSAKDLDDAFEIYRSNSPLVFRDKNNFVPSLEFSLSKARVIHKNGNLIGYYCFTTRKSLGVGELAIVDTAHLKAVLKAIGDFENVKSFNVNANPLDVRMTRALDALCECAALSDGLHIKVYDMARFVQMLLALNIEKGIKRIGNVQETISIVGDCFEVYVNDGKASVLKTNKKPQFVFESAEFLRLAINGTSRAMDESKIFPLAFGISAPDEF